MIVLLVISLIASAKSQTQCTRQTIYAGVGYNLLLGNPNTSPDPGLMRSNHILRYGTIAEYEKVDEQTEYCMPPEISIVPQSFCSYEETTKFFAGTESYRKELELNVRVSASGSYGLASFSFSASNDYKKIEKSTTKSRQVYLDKTAYCYISEQRYKVANIPYEKGYGVTKEFFHVFERLPKQFTNQYYELLQKWGTHIITKATLGGRRIDRSKSTLSELYKFAEETDKASISSSGSYEGYSASLDLDISTLNSQTKSSTSFGKHDTTIIIGSKVQQINKIWQIPADDSNTPEPALIEVMSIASVCDNDGYWSGLANVTTVLSPANEPLRSKCINLKKALKTYADYLTLQNKPDNLRVPLVWPDGTFGLPRAKTGCPDDKGLTFKTGWRKHDTEDHTSNNFFSGSFHLAGWYHKNDLSHEFCIKDVYKTKILFHIATWPRGFYCIYKHGNCPGGFTAGGIYWDDEDHHNKNRAGGTLPDGSYGRDTWIYYCCRNDGPNGYTWPISLPNAKPFFLLRIGGFCQYVRGMTVVEEFIRWDDEDHHNKDKRTGLHPDDTGGSDNHLLHYCYYS